MAQDRECVNKLYNTMRSFVQKNIIISISFFLSQSQVSNDKRNNFKNPVLFFPHFISNSLTLFAFYLPIFSIISLFPLSFSPQLFLSPSLSLLLFPSLPLSLTLSLSLSATPSPFPLAHLSWTFVTVINCVNATLIQPQLSVNIDTTEQFETM